MARSEKRWPPGVLAVEESPMATQQSTDPDRKILERIALTPEQSKVFQNHFGRPAETLEIVEFSPDEAKRLAPGVLKAVGLHMQCW